MSVQPIADNQGPDAGETFDQIERELGVGMVPRIFRLLEGQPVLLAHIWGQFRTIVIRGTLPRVLKEMVGIVVATATHCEYVRVVHLHSLTVQGADKMALDTLSRGEYESLSLSAAVRKVIRFAVLAARTHASYAAPDTDWDMLRAETMTALAETGLDDAEKAELVLTVALFEQICTIANLLALDPHE